MDPASQLDEILNVGIMGSSIVEISKDSLVGRQSIDASGLVVAPGFIDLHEHGQTDEAYGLMVRDGVTSAFELELGTNDVPKWYQERDGGQYVNYGVSISHVRVRMKVMGDEGEFIPSGPAKHQPATKEQVIEIARLLDEGLTQGAIAVGFGLAYTPATNTEEFETMLRIAKKHGASSHIHLRSKGVKALEEGISGAVNVGTPLHVVHINSTGAGETAAMLAMIEEVRKQGHDITTEAYPYEAGMTDIEAAFFDDWENWEDTRFSRHQWLETGEFLTRETFAKYRETGGMIAIHERTEEMTLTAIENPLTIIASDGIMIEGKGHPRTTGSYAKVLGKYVRELGSITLMEALRKMTIAPARRLETHVPQMAKKGRISVGADADITIFDQETVIDQSTYTNPTKTSLGIPFVFVNGKLVVNNGELSQDIRPGKAIRNQ